MRPSTLLHEHETETRREAMAPLGQQTPLMFSVSEFCHAHRIGRGTFYKMLAGGSGPVVTKIGRRTLISCEAAEEWRRRMVQAGSISLNEVKRPPPLATSVAKKG